jgi:hypothetical protein
MFMKYWSQETRAMAGSVSAGPARLNEVDPARDRAPFASIRRAVDWKSTLNLPKTDFPMRADLARREPEWLARWQNERQYERILGDRAREEAPPYVLHDGPPYPTGGIHYGTVLNKVLKDLVVR